MIVNILERPRLEHIHDGAEQNEDHAHDQAHFLRCDLRPESRNNPSDASRNASRGFHPAAPIANRPLSEESSICAMLTAPFVSNSGVGVFERVATISEASILVTSISECMGSTIPRLSGIRGLIRVRLFPGMPIRKRSHIGIIRSNITVSPKVSWSTLRRPR